MISLPVQRTRPDANLKAALALSAVSRDPFQFPVEPTKQGTADVRATTRSFVDVFADIFGATLERYGADPLAWVFSPSRSDTEAREFEFHVDPPGSTVELLGLLLPGLLLRDYPTRLVLNGATHAPWAYKPEQVEPALAPLVREMGGDLEFELQHYGFLPRGPGRIVAEVTPAGRLPKRVWRDRGYVRELEVSAVLAHLQRNIAEREIDAFVEELKADVAIGATLTELHAVSSQGNVLAVEIRGSERTESVAVLGEEGVRAEEIGRRAVSEVATYLKGRGQFHATTPYALLLATAAGGDEMWATGVDELSAAVCEYAPEFLDTHISIEDEETPTTRLKLHRDRP